MYYIIAYMPCFEKSVFHELRKIDDNITCVEHFSPELALIETNLSQKVFTSRLLELDPIFIKHIAPVNSKVNTFKTKSDLKQYLPNLVEEIVNITASTPFSVQARIIGGKSFGLDYTSKDVEVVLGEHFCEDEKRGIPTFSDKDLINGDNVFIISVCITPKNTFIGFSKASENLNFHNNEYRICSYKGEREISRAENKLKEAIAKFSLKLDGGKALDIGAAPGGWTKVLLDSGYSVVAVDPAPLDESLEKHPKVKHLKTKIENLSFDNFFDIIVNDMNMDPDDSAKIMCDLHKSLKEGAKCVLTVKLPFNAEKGINMAKEILKDKFDILKIKNLFHNRQEVTMLLRKK